MRMLHIFLLNLCVLFPNTIQASLTDDDRIYMKEVMRAAKAAEINGVMDTTVDPCSDFYTFACGNYQRRNPSGHKDLTTRAEPYENWQKAFDRKLQMMLRRQSDHHDTPEDGQVKRFYESCTRLTPTTYMQGVKELIAEFGSMPVLVGDAWREEDFDWLHTTRRITLQYGVTAIIAVWEEQSTAQTVRVLGVGQPKFPLGESKNPSHRNAYRQEIEDTLKSLLGKDTYLARRTAQELFNFEDYLAEYRSYENQDPNEAYLQHLAEVIKNTPRRTVANYIFFMLIREFAGIPRATPKEQKEGCISLTKVYFSKNLDNIFYRRYWHRDSSADIEDIWQRLKATFNQTLLNPQLECIQQRAKGILFDKLQAMTLQIRNYVDVNFTKEMEGLNLQSSSYFHNMRQARMWATRRHREQELPPSKDISYDAILNSILVPVACLQANPENQNSPKALMFGTMAFLIGHQLIWGLGTYANDQIYSWDEESKRNLDEREKCFREKYGNSGYKLNMAYDEGLKIAYGAYKTWLEEQTKLAGSSDGLDRERLPSLEYTSQQLFFLSFAQMWCYEINENQSRVTGAVTNSHNFSHEFNCLVGSPMNTQKKCSLY